MKSISVILALGFFGLNAIAQDDTEQFPPYTVTGLSTYHSSGRPGNINVYRVNADIWDSNEATNASTSCLVQWPLDEPNGYPHDYVDCDDPSFQFYIDNWNGIGNFTLLAKHTYNDSRVGEPPQNVVTTFAKTDITYDFLQYTCGGSGVCSASKKDGIDISMPVYAAIA